LALALLIEGTFHWGFSVRMISESAAANPYPVPPPSTLVGALAYGCAIVKRFSECYLEKNKKYSTAAKLVKYILWSTFSLKGNNVCLTSYSDMLRMFSLPYQRGARHEPKYRDMWFGVRAHGKVYYPNGGFGILYLLDDGIIEFLGGEDILLRAASHIVRLGSREGLVSISNISLSSSISVVNPPIRTSFYFPKKLVKVLDRENVTLVTLPVFSKDLYLAERITALPGMHEEYYVPLAVPAFWLPGDVEVRVLNDEGAALKIDFGDNRQINLIVPKRVAKLAGV